MDFSIPLNWTSPFPSSGVSGVCFYFYFISAASDLGLHCLAMSQKWDARLIWVNNPSLIEAAHLKIVGVT